MDYAPLWETMEKRRETTYSRITKYGTRTVHDLKHNKSVTIYTLERLCQILDCTPNEAVRFARDA